MEMGEIHNRLLAAHDRLIQSKELDSVRLRDDYDYLYQCIASVSQFDDKTLTLLNDTLSVCMNRMHQSLKKGQILEDHTLGLDRVFEYVREYQHHSNHKVIKSLYSALTKAAALQNALDPSNSRISSWIHSQVISCSPTKNYFQTLDVLLKHCTSTDFMLEKYPTRVATWITTIGLDGLANSISKTFLLVISKLSMQNDNQWYLAWHRYVFNTTLLNDESMRNNAFTYLIPRILQSRPQVISFVSEELKGMNNLASIDIRDDMHLSILLIKKDLKIDTDDMIDHELLLHANTKIRLKALSYLFGGSSPKKNKSSVISKDVFSIIKNERIIEVYMNDYEDVVTRNSFVSLFNQFLSSRFIDSKASWEKAGKTKELKHYTEFIEWLNVLLVSYLVPSSTYSQIITSLQLLETLIKVNLCTNTATLIQNLATTSFHDYENVRELAVKILLKCDREMTFSILASNDMKASAFKALGSLRGRKSEGGSVFINFLACLYLSNNKPEMAIELLNEVVSHIKVDIDIPCHGHFKAAGLIIESIQSPVKESHALKNIYLSVIDKLFGIWEMAKSYLANDTFDDENETRDTHKSYAWRAIKDSNYALSKILSSNDCFSILDVSKFLDCCNLVITQLSSVKHRGAFSSIYPTFIEICSLCSKHPELREYPTQWLKDNISMIENKTQYVSRRSGGLPYLVSGVLLASTDNSNELAKFTFLELMRIACLPYDHKADEQNDIPQVHAFNCMKQIFIESDLHSIGIEFADVGLTLALKEFNSNNWSIRNCAVMLFNSIQQRVFGNQSAYSFDLFFNKFPSMEHTMLEKLLNQENLFPVIILLSRLDGSRSQNNSVLNRFKSATLSLLKHKYWKVREMVARVVISLHSAEELISYITAFNLEGEKDLNKIHGLMLVVLGTIEKAGENEVEAVIQKTACILQKVKSIHVRKACFAALRKMPKKNYTQEFVSEIQLMYESEMKASIHNEKQYLLSEMLLLLLEVKTSNEEDITPLIVNAFSCTHYLEVQEKAIEFVAGKGKLAKTENLDQIIWQTVMDAKCFDHIRARLLQLYSTILDNGHGTSSTIKENLRRLLANSSRAVKSSAFECWGSLYNRDEEAAFFEILKNLLVDGSPFEDRYTAVRALSSALKNPHSSKLKLAMLAFSRILCDDDEEIRRMTARALCTFYFKCSPLNSFTVAGKIARSITTEAKDFIFDLISDEILNEDDMTILKATHENGAESIFSVERSNLYKNEVLFTKDVCSIISRVEFSSKELANLKKLSEERYECIRTLLKDTSQADMDEWLREGSYFSLVTKTLLYCQAFGLEGKDWGFNLSRSGVQMLLNL